MKFFTVERENKSLHYRCPMWPVHKNQQKINAQQAMNISEEKNSRKNERERNLQLNFVMHLIQSLKALSAHKKWCASGFCCKRLHDIASGACFFSPLTLFLFNFC